MSCYYWFHWLAFFQELFCSSHHDADLTLTPRISETLRFAVAYFFLYKKSVLINLKKIKEYLAFTVHEVILIYNKIDAWPVNVTDGYLHCAKLYISYMVCKFKTWNAHNTHARMAASSSVKIDIHFKMLLKKGLCCKSVNQISKNGQALEHWNQ